MLESDLKNTKEIPVADIINNLQEFVETLHPVVAFLAVFGVGMVPFLESYVGSLIGVIGGVGIAPSLIAAIGGNILAVLIAGTIGGAISKARKSRPNTKSGRGARIVERTDKFGVPVASLLAPTLLAISLTTFIMVTLGYRKSHVIIWNIVAAIA